MLIERIEEQPLALPHALRAIEHRIVDRGQAVQLVAPVVGFDDVAAERFRAHVRRVADAGDRANIAPVFAVDLRCSDCEIVGDRVEHVLIGIELRDTAAG